MNIRQVVSIYMVLLGVVWLFLPVVLPWFSPELFDEITNPISKSLPNGGVIGDLSADDPVTVGMVVNVFAGLGMGVLHVVVWIIWMRLAVAVMGKSDAL